ncbi:ArsR/SmtB family transcription factor [Lentilitoribacter sp. EG35]|uniref:ArsR/SmtB family transcription factor n=1 Tax=Lentilitoribacter sp. EG35 TaxID=3234192 RepID=UPI003460B356
MNLDIKELEPKIAQAANLMEMLSQPARLRILCILLNGEQSVLDLSEQVGMSQPGMSHHLKKLRTAELVKTRREAQTIFYSLNGIEVSTVMETLYNLYCAPK